MKIIGIVGGVGAGKSYVAQAMARRGAVVVDADRVGHEVLECEHVRSKVRRAFGDAVFAADGSVKRRELAALVFAPNPGGEEQLRRLEAITHPEIERRLRTRIRELANQGVSAVVLDAAIMVRTGWHRMCDELVLVEADDATREARAARRGWSREEWQTRESRQTAIDELRRLSSAIIVNGGETAQSVDDQVAVLWQRWGLGTTS